MPIKHLEKIIISLNLLTNYKYKCWNFDLRLAYSQKRIHQVKIVSHLYMLESLARREHQIGRIPYSETVGINHPTFTTTRICIHRILN